MSRSSLSILAIFTTNSVWNLYTGNKADLEQLREVRKEEAAAMARQHNMLDALEASAKDNTNIDEAFYKIAKVCSGS